MKRTVADFTFAVDLLEALIHDDTSRAITLVICSTRQAFLRQIAPTILTPQAQEIPASQEGSDEDESPQEPLPHRFLVPTLGLLASAKALKLAFCPSVKSLRAYLSICTAATKVTGPCETDDMGSLIIVDLVLLHRDTLEYSVQGLSRSFACGVEAAARNSMNLRLVECRDIHGVHDSSRGYDLWNAQVPLLSGSVRLGGDGESWAGRVISVKNIASRWFELEEKRPEADGSAPNEEDEEMLV